jgi:hypothetical protein
VSNRYSPFRKRRSPPRPSLLPRKYVFESRCARHAGFESLEPRTLLAGTVLADYAVTQNWGSGFQSQITLANQQTTSVSNWTLEFDYGASISSIWDGEITSHVGTHYVVTNAGWNSMLAAAEKSPLVLSRCPAQARPARLTTCSMASHFPDRRRRCPASA